MQIRDKETGQTIKVYAVYWVDGITYFCWFPRGNGGLSTLTEAEVDVLDPEIGPDFLLARTTRGWSMVAHKHLLPDALLDDLFEHDPTAYQRLCTLMGGHP